MIYTGIGSRRTPQHILDDMQSIGFTLSEMGYLLRSGNANGDDKAFAKGCDLQKGNSEIYLPFNNFNGGCRNSIFINNKTTLKQAHDIMVTLKPKGYTFNSRNTPFHRRNVFQILGGNLTKQTDFVICYTDTGAENEKQIIERNDNSGTALAMTLASRLNIPIINMYNSDWLTKLEILLGD